MKPLLITIDGPAGAGKTTVSRELAAVLNYRYVDTGALYRGVALAARDRGVDPGNEAGLAALCQTLDLRFVLVAGKSRLFSNGVDISDHIRTMEISMLASAVSARPVVRAFLLTVQRRLGEEKEVVFEGRDMGTVVFPEADVKFFLDASIDERARRRYAELSTDTDLTLVQVREDIRRRDENDRTRAEAPLKAADDAVIIDSTASPVEEVVRRMLNCIRQHP